MSRRDGAYTRTERLHKMAEIILSNLAKNNGEISLSKTIATFEYEFGLTGRKVKEYLKVLEENERFVIVEDKDKIQSMPKTEESVTSS